jgi:hypothetical protein
MLKNQKRSTNARKKPWFWVSILIIIINMSIIISTQCFKSNTTKKPEISSAQEQNTPQPDSTLQCFEAGKYKVGTNFPAGEYVIIGTGYLKICSDDSGLDESIIEADNFVNRAIVLVSEGEYFEFEGLAYSSQSAPKVDISMGELEDGEYKVGVDFEEGEYKITPHKGSGYYEISESARGELKNVIHNNSISKQEKITLKTGQYINLENIVLELK